MRTLILAEGLGAKAAGLGCILTPIYTGMSDARNAIIAWTSDLAVALKGSFGMNSEVALAFKSRHPGHFSVLPGV